MSILDRGHARHGVVVPKIAPISGRYYSHRSAYSGTATTVALTASLLYGTPFFVPSSMTVDLIALNVTTAAAAGKLLRLGVYTATAAGLPDALLVDSGALAADTAAPFVASASISLTLAPGQLYYLAYFGDGTPTVTATVGVVAPYGNADSTNASPLSIYVRSLAYGALPASFGTGTGYSQSPPHVCVRAV